MFENFNGGYFPQQNFNPYNFQNMQAKNNQPVGGNFIWVNSRKEAEEYPLGANGAQMMMNRNEKVFYLKSCDGFGMVQSFREFPYYEKESSDNSEIAINSEVNNPANYVNREEFEALKAEIEALKSFKSAKRVKEDNTDEK